MTLSDVPRSRRPLFPCIAKSSTMKDMINRAASIATQGRILPIMSDESSLEMPSLIHAIAAKTQTPGRAGLTPDQLFEVRSTDESERVQLNRLCTQADAKGIIFFKGECIGRGVQEAIVQQIIPQQYRFFVVILPESTSFEKLLATGAWMHNFYRMCSTPIRPPEWMWRAEDQDDIISEIARRLQPHTFIDEPARSLLKAKAVKGVDTIKRLIDEANKRLILERGDGSCRVTDLQSLNVADRQSLGDDIDLDTIRVITARHMHEEKRLVKVVPSARKRTPSSTTPPPAQ